jgi:hypothetical protein
MPALLTSVSNLPNVYTACSTIFCAVPDEVKLTPIVVCFAKGCSGLFLVDGESRISKSSDSASLSLSHVPR